MNAHCWSEETHTHEADLQKHMLVERGDSLDAKPVEISSIRAVGARLYGARSYALHRFNGARSSYVKK